MDYPQHEFSKYIDNEFSYSNNVSDMNMDSGIGVDRFQDTICQGNIMLDPKLQEYIKKKKYYRANKIEPIVPLEKQFNITDYDKKVIREFLKGKRDMYKTDNLEINKTKPKKKNYFPSKKFRDLDERQDRLKIKENFDKPINMGMFSPDDYGSYYEDQQDPEDTNDIIDSRDFDDSIFNKRIDRGFDPRVDPRIRPGMETLNPDLSPYKVNGQVGKRHYNVGGKFNGNKVMFNQMLDSGTLSAVPNSMRSRNANRVEQEHLQWNRTKNRSIKKQKNPEAIYGFSKNENEDMFFNTHKNSLDDRYYNLSGTSKGVCDANLETEMMHGIPSRSGKSYGYRNSEEHNFNYIDPEFQNEVNTTSLPYHGFGEPTRNHNRRYNQTPYTRDIL